MRVKKDILEKYKSIEKDIESKSFQAIMFKSLNTGKKSYICILALLISLPILAGLVISKEIKKVTMGEEITIELASSPIAATSTKRGTITIPTGNVNINPFLPYRDVNVSKSGKDVPSFELVEPPEMINNNSDAVRVMDTIVSGILYDKFSPSAILNIEGNDYLVKKNDVINNYEILNITQESVTVKLGSNIYKAGIGEILTEGSVNHNTVSNLNNKFGGAK